MRAVAAKLAAHGFHVRGPDWEDGRRLKAKGLEVCLEVYEDHVAYEVAAEIVVTNPVRPDRGRVHVTDDGALMWECCYEAGPADGDAVAVADTIAAVLAEDAAGGRAHPGPAAPTCGGRGGR
jgi:hypothetical protein